MFVFFAGDISAAVGQHDLVTDFLRGIDLIDLSGIDADIRLAGVDAFRFIGGVVFDGLAAALNFFFEARRNVTVLQGDTNGDFAADFAIDFSGALPLSYDDFTTDSLRLLGPAQPDRHRQRRHADRRRCSTTRCPGSAATTRCAALAATIYWTAGLAPTRWRAARATTPMWWTTPAMW